MAAAAVLATTASAAAAGHPASAATLLASTSGPVSIYPATTKPAGVEWTDHAGVELGVVFHVSEPGRITALKYYRPGSRAVASSATLWTASGHRLATAQFGRPTSLGWQTVTLSEPVTVTKDTSYVASYHADNGRYAETVKEFYRGRTSGNSIIQATGSAYAYGRSAVFPTADWFESGYGADVDFVPATVSDPAPNPPGAGSSPAPAPTSTQPSSTQPSSTQPSSTQPSSTQPSSTQPSSTEPSSTEPPSTAPSSTQPSSTEPSSTEPSSEPAPSSSAPPTSSDPSAGYPDASNTGVPDGTTLTAVPGTARSGPGWSWDTRGWVSVTGANAVFAGYRVTGTVEVYAKGAVIRDNDIEADGNGWAIGLRPSASDVTVSHNTLHGPCRVCTNRLTYGIFGDLGGDAGSVIDANNLYNIDHPLQQERGLVENNYVHSLAATPAGTDHVDAFFSGGGTPDQLTIRHNTLLNDYLGDGSTASIMLNNAFGQQSNRLVEDNYLAGGGFTVYGGWDGKSIGHNTIIRNNKFSTRYYPKSGYYDAVVYLQGGPTNQFTGNTWADGPNAGKVIVP